MTTGKIMVNPINFIAQKNWLDKNSNSAPLPIIKTIPDWYRKADRFVKDSYTHDFIVGPDGGNIPTWKACPAVFDVMSTGYCLITPCDIEFYYNNDGVISAKTLDPKYSFFCSDRQPMPQFVTPCGYEDKHFAWMPDWTPTVPSGYSVLYSQPFNRFELPFLTVSGIIDNDKIDRTGSAPFFIQKGFTGILPSGTPYLQMLPFKRENWKMSHTEDDANSIIKKVYSNSKRFRKPNGGVYKNEVWEPRKYE
jgi:hypothetical protein